MTLSRPLDRDDVAALRAAAAACDRAADHLMARAPDAAARLVERAAAILDRIERGERGS